MSTRAWLRLWVPVVAYMAFIFYMSSLSQPPSLPGDLADTSWHSMGYAVLAVLVTRALAGGLPARIGVRVALLAVLIATVYGATDEWHQRFVPGRTADVRDLFADVRGAVIGVAACWACGIILVRSDV